MAREVEKLVGATFKTLGPGRHSDGDGLYLIVDPSGARRWMFLYRFRGRRREMGLGAAEGKRPDQKNGLSLSGARDAVRRARANIKAGIDPIDGRRPADEIPTFGDMADRWYDRMKPQWSNVKYQGQIRQDLTVRAKALRALPVNEVDTARVLAVLTPIWSKIPTTARRTRGVIEGVLNAAKALGFRQGQNPAAWRGHLAELLPKDKPDPKHFASLPHGRAPAFMASLRARKSRRAGMALQFLMLTAVRSGDAMNATWGEIDAAEKVWTIPAPRMKMRKEHHVPLSPQAVEILKAMARSRGYEGDDAIATIAKAKPDAFIFPGNGSKAPLSGAAMTMLLRRMEKSAGDDWIKITNHGFRATFKSWASDETGFQREIVEMGLAHQIGSAVEQAYYRTDALAKRRKLMEAWANYCTGANNVRQLKKAAA